jgi:hypothetical protein
LKASSKTREAFRAHNGRNPYKGEEAWPLSLMMTSSGK